tara:strand:+ start:85 stop:255 length:171 start_codon:yes stop_codon:yes gene_type:complete
MANIYELAEQIALLLEQEGWQVEDHLYIEEMLRNEKKRQPREECATDAPFVLRLAD